MQDSQLLAAKILEKVLTGSNLDKSFDSVFNYHKSNNEEIQEPQIKALTYGAVRFLGHSSFLINQLVKNKINNKILEALIHIAFYQLSQDKSNDFTIVDQAVNAAKKIDYRKSKFVNAILRNYLRNKDRLQNELILDQTARYSYQGWWINKVKNEFKNNWEEILNIGNQHPPLTLRVNKRKISVEQYSKILKKNELDFELVSNDALIIIKPVNIMSFQDFKKALFQFKILGHS